MTIEELKGYARGLEEGGDLPAEEKLKRLMAAIKSLRAPVQLAQRDARPVRWREEFDRYEPYVLDTTTTPGWETICGASGPTVAST